MENKHSKEFNQALIKSAMVREMAIADGWKGLDECLEQAPQALDILLRHADAAVKALDKLELKPSSDRAAAHRFS